MKKKLFTLLTLLLCLCSGAWATDLVVNVDQIRVLPTQAGLVKINKTGENASNTGLSGGKLNFGSSKTGTFTIYSTNTDRYKIKSISFTTNRAPSAFKCTDTNTDVAGSSTSWTYTPDSPVDNASFSLASTSSSTTASVTVTLTTASTDIVEKLSTFSKSSNTFGFTSSAATTQVEITDVGDDASSASSNLIQCSASNSKKYGLKFKAKEGYNLKFVSFYFYDTDTEPTTSNISPSTGTYTPGSYTWTSTSTTSEVTFTIKNSNKNYKFYNIYVGYEEAPVTTYAVTYEAGDHGTAPSSTTASTFTLPTMDADGDWTNTGWTANQTVKVGGNDVSAGTFIAAGTSVTISQATTFTGVWQKAISPSLSYDNNPLVLTIRTTGTPTLTGNTGNGTVTWQSSTPSVATVDESGNITALAAGSTTITANIAASGDYKAGSATCEVKVAAAPAGLVDQKLATGNVAWDASVIVTEDYTNISDLTALSQHGTATASGNGNTNNDGQTSKIGTATGDFNADNYLELSFTVAEGKRINISSIAIPVQPVSSNTNNFKAVLSDNKGSSNIEGTKTNLTNGNLANIDFASYGTLKGTVTLKIYAWGWGDGYRLGKNIVIDGTIEDDDNRTVLTAAWSDATPSFNAGSAATVPTFTVTGGTLGADYTVAYTKTDENNIVTLAAENAGIEAINTAAAATAKVTATVTVVNTAEYKMETTSYDCDITVAAPVVPTPTLTAGGYFITDSKSVEIACEDGSATIKYSTDNEETWNTYTTALTLTETTTVKAKAIRDGYTDSEVASATYTKFVKSALASVSGLKTWTIPTSLTLELKDDGTTAPAKYDDYFTYADIATINSNDLGTFDGETLAFSGQYPYRGKYAAQNGNFKIETTVPGIVTVEFSNTSGGNKERWIKVNETTGTVEADGTDKQTESFTVSAGTVTITHVDKKGDLSNGLRVYSIKFVPTVTASVGAKGYATYCNSNYALDFTGKSIKAYTISSTNGSKLTLTQKDKVAKNEPVLLYSATNSDSQTIPAIADGDATADATNKLVAGDGAAHTWAEGTEHYILYTGGDNPGFYRANKSVVAVGKAYLDLTGLPTTARSFDLNLAGGATTGIANLNVDDNDNLNAEAPMYNLAGQRVNKSYKGVVIVNGKKVVRK